MTKFMINNGPNAWKTDVNLVILQLSFQWPVARFSKVPESFRARKAIFRSSVSINGEVYTPETSCMKGTSLHLQNKWIKQLCNRKVRDFAMALRARKVSGAFEKRATGLWMAVTLVWRRPHCFCCVNQVLLMLIRSDVREEEEICIKLGHLACIHRPGIWSNNWHRTAFVCVSAYASVIIKTALSNYA